jgi:hypothetical protein
MKVRKARKIVRNPKAYNPSEVRKAYRQLTQTLVASGFKPEWTVVYYDPAYDINYFVPPMFCWIENVAQKLPVLAHFYGPLLYEFNGIVAIVWEDWTAEEIQEDWRERYTIHEQFQLEGIMDKQMKQTNLDQIRVEQMMVTLPSVLPDLLKTIRWLKEFVPLAENRNIRVDVKNLLAMFAGAGYRVAENVLEDVNVEDQRNLLSDFQRYGRYVVGQAMACWAEFNVVHPMVASMASECEALSIEKLKTA